MTRPGQLLKIIIMLSLGLVTLPPRDTAAAGQITGVTTTPSPANVGRAVTITVNGIGTCGTILVDFGDGDVRRPHPISLQNVSLPKDIVHTYGTAGNFRITAAPGTSCTGATGGVNLMVQSAITYATNLQRLSHHPLIGGATGSGSQDAIDIGGTGMTPAATAPQITGLCPLDVVQATGSCPQQAVKPQWLTFVSGASFGTTPGQLTLTLTNYKGQVVTGVLAIDEWHDAEIIAHPPPDISGFLDQWGKVHVVTSAGRVSNEWPVQFTAWREPRFLPYNSLSKAACGEGGADEINSCGGDDTNTFRGYHDGTRPASGTDYLSVRLRNGFVLLRNHVYEEVNSVSFRGFAEGSANADMEVYWSMGFWQGPVMYIVDLIVVGPKGVPLR